jgi:hypothetical protein
MLSAILKPPLSLAELSVSYAFDTVVAHIKDTGATEKKEQKCAPLNQIRKQRHTQAA